MRKTYSILTIILVSVFLFSSNNIIAQISEGGNPYSTKLELDDNIKIHEFSKIDIAKINLEDETRDSNGEFYRYGVSIKAGLSLSNSGVWTNLDNGDRIWRLKLKADDALAIGVYYDDFWLPEGGRLFLYNENKTQII